MNKRIEAIVGVLLIAVVIISLCCIGGIGGGGSAKEVAKMLPKDTGGLTYIDIQTIRGDKDLEDIFEEIEDEFDEKYGIDVDDTNYMAEAGRSIKIIGGKFDLEEVRDELDDQDYDEGDYRGVELWTGRYEAVAISKDKLIIGSEEQVKDCIKVMKGYRTSWYDDDEDIRDVIDKLPDGIMTMVATGHYGYEDLLASGFVLTKEDEYTLKNKGVLKFEDEDDAEDAMEDLEDDLEDEADFDDVEVKQKGEYVEFTAKIDIEDWEEVI